MGLAKLMTHSRIIRLPEVKFRTSLPRSSIYDLIKKGLFPKQIKLMSRSVGWLESEIDEWIDRKHKNTPYHS
jgi:prophage regulatory protein